MKKVLSITLTLAMLLGSFLMLVPTVSATEGAGTATTGSIYYANDFDDVTATTADGILASIGWEIEEGKPNAKFGQDSTISVVDGRLVIYAGQGADQNSENFVVIKNNQDLKNGYVVEYDLEMLAKDEGTGADSAFSVHTALSQDFTKRNGRHGWISQIRWNTNVLSGCEDGTGWKPAVNGTPQAAKDTYLKKVEGEGEAQTTTVAADMQNIRVSVRVEFDATAKTIKTYVKAYEPNATFTDADLMQTATPNTDAGLALLTENLRFLVYKGIKVAIDNVRVGTADAFNAVSRDVIYTQNFDAVTGANTTEVLTALGWETEQEWAADTQSSVAVEGGRLIVDAVTDQEEFVVLKDNAKLLGGYIIECDIEILNNTKWDEATSAWVDGPTDNAVGFVSSLCTDWTQRAGRHGWWSQIRAYCGVLAGSEDGTGWKNVDNKTKMDWFMAESAEGATQAQLAKNVRIHWRAEFDLDGKIIKSYAKHYVEGQEVAWTADDLRAQSNQEGYEALVTDDLRFIVYKGMKVALDNLTVFKNIPTPIPVNGETTPVAYGALDLSTFVDGTFAFAVINGTQVVTESGYTMDKYVTSIDVYSLSVTALKGASIRTAGDAALRFRTAVSKADIDGLNAAMELGAVTDVEFGTLVIDYATLGALGQLKLDTEGATKVLIEGDDDVSEYGTDDYALNCVIEVAADKLNTKYAAAGYVIVTFNDGSKLELTAKYDKYTMVRSVAEIAQTITFDEAHGLSAAQLQVVNTYAAAYVAD